MDKAGEKAKTDKQRQLKRQAVLELWLSTGPDLNKRHRDPATSEAIAKRA